MTDYLAKLPPDAVESEVSLLGSMMIDPSCIDDVVCIVAGPGDFSDPKHGLIYSRMVGLYDGQGSLDLVQLEQSLDDSDVLKHVGGKSYLIELAQAVPSSHNAVRYAEEIRRKAVLGELIDLAGRMLTDCHVNPGEVQRILEDTETTLYAIAHASEQNTAIATQDLIPECMEHLTGEAQKGLGTGIDNLDVITGGMRSGELIILAARPSMGKTALGLCIASRCAYLKHVVGFFSLEMDRHQIGFRLLSLIGEIPSELVRHGALKHVDDCQKAMLAADQAMGLPIHIDDTPGLSLMQLRSKARRMRSKHKIELLVVDYLQLMHAGGKQESRQVEVGAISRGLKQLAREMRIPVLCLSQVNRQAEARSDKRPQMSDLRESGAIEQDADAVWLLHREHYYDSDAPPDLADLMVRKNRQGPTGDIELKWDGRYMKFSNCIVSRRTA